MKLSLTCQLADERAQARPDDQMAQRYAEAVRFLFLDALVLPEDHELFRSGARHAGFPLVEVISKGSDR